MLWKHGTVALTPLLDVTILAYGSLFPPSSVSRGLVEVRQARFIAGSSPTKRKKSLQSEKSLTKLVGRLYTPGYDEMDFLKSVAHHFSLGAH